MARQLLDGGMGLWMSRERLDGVDRGLALALHSAYLGVGARAIRTPTMAVTSELARGAASAELMTRLASARSLVELAKQRSKCPDARAVLSIGPSGLPASEAERASSIYSLLSSVLREVALDEVRAVGAVLLLESFRAWGEIELALDRLEWPGETWVFVAPLADGRLADDDVDVPPARRAARAAAILAKGRVSVMGLGCHDAALDLGAAVEQLAACFPSDLALSLPAFGNGLDWAARAHALAEREPRIQWIGGCCGTGPAHIAALARLESPASLMPERIVT